MPELIDAQTRMKIARFLPDALATALHSYYDFSRLNVSDDPKNFSAFHSACKVAIAHIELLLKLAKYAHLPDDGVVADEEQRKLVTMLESAQLEFNEYQSRKAQEQEQEAEMETEIELEAEAKADLAHDNEPTGSA